MTNCLPSASDNSSGGSGGGGNTSSGGDTGSSSSTDDSGGSGGTTYSSSSTHSSGGTTHATTSTTATGGTTHATTSTTATGGTTYATTTSSPATGGSTTTPPTTTATGGTPPAGGSTGGPPTGTTVTFANGKGVGAMTGYGWVALGSLDSLSDPKCGTSPFTSTTNCAAATWSTTTSLCITGAVPALGATPDYTNNWGVSVGVNSTDPAGTGLGQPFTSVAITVTGSPTSGLRAMMHKKGDPDATSYCATLTSGTAMPMTGFSTTCYTPASPGTALTAADVPNIDKISVQVSSGPAAVTVANLCITGITFAK
jgi:hypothetical protein